MENDHSEYLKVPRMYSFGISRLYFSAYFVSPQKYLAVLFCSLLLIGLPSLYYWWKAKKLIVKFFNLETLNPNLLVFSF
jgi:hypothetical protein